MSGGIGPSADINLQEEENEIQKQSQNLTTPQKFLQKSTKPFFLSLRQLNCLAIMIILASSGMINLEEISIFIFALIYVHFLNYLTQPQKYQPVFDPNSKILSIYITFAAIIGLFLPVLYIFHGILEGDQDGIKSASPHVFVLASQVFMEGLTGSDRYSIPIRVFVPVFFNGYRLLTIRVWIENDFGRNSSESGVSNVRLNIGRVLGVVNGLLWFYNLFGFLLPVYLPKAFKICFSGNQKSSDSKKD